MDEWHKSDWQKRRLDEPFRGFVDLNEVLRIARLSKGNNHASTVLELIEQGGRRIEPRGGYDDAVKGRLGGPPQPSIANDRCDVGGAAAASLTRPLSNF